MPSRERRRPCFASPRPRSPEERGTGRLELYKRAGTERSYRTARGYVGPYLAARLVSLAQHIPGVSNVLDGLTVVGPWRPDAARPRRRRRYRTAERPCRRRWGAAPHALLTRASQH